MVRCIKAHGVLKIINHHVILGVLRGNAKKMWYGALQVLNGKDALRAPQPLVNIAPWRASIDKKWQYSIAFIRIIRIL